MIQKRTVAKIPFKISTSSMVLKEDLLQNVHYLSDFFDYIEIILYQTDALNNLPTGAELATLARIAEQKKISYSVHLPSSLEIASHDKKKRMESIERICNIINLMTACHPRNYVLHIPFTTPILTFIPGCYFYETDRDNFVDWTVRAMTSLRTVQQLTGIGDGLLVENINYSPQFLDPFLEQQLCQLCLDLGHLMLGRENVLEILKKYAPITPELHLHGVKGDIEHQTLSVVPFNRVKRWLHYLDRIRYKGVVNFEVFTPDDLEAAVGILSDAFG